MLNYPAKCRTSNSTLCILAGRNLRHVPRAFAASSRAQSSLSFYCREDPGKRGFVYTASASFCRALIVFCRELILFCRELILFCRELIVFCRELILFCRELIVFCRRKLIVFCRELIVFCRDVSICCEFILFCRDFFILPLHLWATVLFSSVGQPFSKQLSDSGDRFWESLQATNRWPKSMRTLGT